MNIKCLSEAAYLAKQMSAVQDAARWLGDRPRKVTIEINITGQTHTRVEIDTVEFNCDVLVEALRKIEAGYRGDLRALGVTGFDGDVPEGP